MLLAINRYFRVVRPALYINIFSKKRSVAMAVSVWVVTIAVILVLYFATRKQFQGFTVEKAPLCVKFLHNDVLWYHTYYLYGYSQWNHCGVLQKDLSNYSSTQHCSRSIVTRGTFFLRSGRGENNKNADCCRGWILFLLATTTY